LLGRVKTIVEPADNRLAGVTLSVKVPAVTIPGNLSAGAEFAAGATVVTVEPTATTLTAAETAEITPFEAEKACRVNIPLAVLENILNPVRIRAMGVAAVMDPAATEHVIVV